MICGAACLDFDGLDLVRREMLTRGYVSPEVALAIDRFPDGDDDEPEPIDEEE